MLSFFFALGALFFPFFNRLVTAEQQVLTQEQKIGQLLIADCRVEEDHEELYTLVEKGLVGSVLLKGFWTKAEEIALTTKLKELAPLPLFIMQDCEWGFAMRVTDMIPYPMGGTLAHLDRLDLFETLGKLIAQEGKELGVNFCLAPVCDVHSNPLNPIIGLRSFGSDPFNVAIKTRAVIRGIQGEGLISSAKHYPGHGNTSVDSHLSLPVEEVLRAEDLYPFHEAIKEGVASILVGHIVVKQLDKKPASLSKKVIEAINYNGLIVTDDLNMGAITNHMTLPEAAVEALLAGNDLLMVSNDIREAIKKINSIVPNIVIDSCLQKVLTAKKSLVETEVDPIDPITFKREVYEELIPPQKPLIGTHTWLEYGDEMPQGYDHLLLAVRQPNVKYQRMPLTDEQIAYIDHIKNEHPSVTVVLFCNPYPEYLGDHILAYQSDDIAKEVVTHRLMGAN